MGADRTDLVHAMLERLEVLAQKSPVQGLPSTPPGAKGRHLVDNLVERAVEIHRGDYDSALNALQATYVEPMKSTVPRPNGVSAAPAAPQVLEVTPEVSGRYTEPQSESEHELGRGGMGRVVLALDRHMGREVAVKELLTTHARDAETVESELRFVREARICAQLEHPNVVPVYELGRRANGALYYTMKVIRGRTLAIALAEASTPRERLGLLGHYAGVCQAIAYAHSRGIIHGDLKPQNVMIGEFGETLVLDWGGAKLKSSPLNRSDGLSQSLEHVQPRQHAWLGTPLYMSPEQASGDIAEIDERSDVWALGVVLYQLITGQYPFLAQSVAELIPKILDGHFIPVQKVAPELDPVLSAIVDRALARDPDLRYRSARELMQDIDSYRSGERVGSYAYSFIELFTRFVERNRAAFVIAAASLVLLLGLSVMSYRRLTQSRDRAVAAESQAKHNEKQALHHLAEVFTTQAGVAQTQGDPLAGAIFAAKALALEERADARGYAIALQDAIRWAPMRPELRCERAAFAANGTIACVQDDHLTLLQDSQTWSAPEGALTSGHPLLSDDGSALVTYNDRSIQLLTRSGAELISHPLLVTGANSAALSDDGQQLAIGTQSGQVLLLRDGKQETAFKFGEPVTALAFRDDGSLFAGGRFGRLMQYSRVALPTAGTLHGPAYHERPLVGHAGTITVLRTSKATDLIASSSADRTVRLWTVDNTSANPTSKIISDDTASTLALSADGRLLAYSTADYSIRLFDLARQHHIARLRAHNSPIEQLTFTDTLDLLSSSSDISVQRWRYTPPSQPRDFASRSNVLSLASRDDGRVLLSAGIGSGGVCVWDTAAAHCRTRLPVKADAVRAISISPDGRLIAVAGTKGYAMLWNAQEHLPFKLLSGHTDDVRSVMFSRDGTRVVTASLDGSVIEWSTATGLELQRAASSVAASAARYSEDSTRLAVALRDGSIRVLDASDFHLVTRFSETSQWATDVTFAKQDKRLVAAYADRKVRIFDLEQERITGQVEGFGGRVLSVAVTPNQRWFAAAGEDPVIRLYDLETLTLVAKLEQHTADVRVVTPTDTGSYLLSGSDDGIIRFWPLQALQTDGAAWLAELERVHGLTLRGTTLVRTPDNK